MSTRLCQNFDVGYAFVCSQVQENCDLFTKFPAKKQEAEVSSKNVIFVVHREQMEIHSMLKF